MEVQKNHSPAYFGHIISWLLALCLPILLGEQGRSWHFFVRHTINVGMVALVFYSHYLWLIPQFYMANKKVLFGIIMVLTFGIVVLLSSKIDMRPKRKPIDNKSQATEHQIKKPRPGENTHIVFMRAIFITLAGAGSALGITMAKNYQREKEARKTLENEQLKSELAMLKYQIQPHFFFNSLNTIYASIDANPTAAKEATLKLSKLMRYMLYRANDARVPLKEEIDFIVAFIDLMTIRTSKNVKVSAQLPTENMEHYLIEPLLFIALVENAFKHGIAPSEESSIGIDISIANGTVKCEVTNTYFPKTEGDHSGSGVGLSNLKKRLEKLYPLKNYQLNTSIENNQFIARLTLPLS